MVYYYESIEHINSSDDEEEVITITSTAEEKKKIVSILIYFEANAGYLNAYIDREKILSHPTARATIRNYLELEIDAELAEGEEFKLTLKNRVSGNNAEIYGAVKYEIVS